MFRGWVCINVPSPSAQVAIHRKHHPETIPFRLTRMLVQAMEVSGIEGTFRFTCEAVMRVLRENRDSVMAMLEAFVHDPLINWRLLTPNQEAQKKKGSVPGATTTWWLCVTAVVMCDVCLAFPSSRTFSCLHMAITDREMAPYLRLRVTCAVCVHCPGASSLLCLLAPPTLPIQPFLASRSSLQQALPPALEAQLRQQSPRRALPARVRSHAVTCRRLYRPPSLASPATWVSRFTFGLRFVLGVEL